MEKAPVLFSVLAYLAALLFAVVAAIYNLDKIIDRDHRATYRVAFTLLIIAGCGITGTILYVLMNF